MLGPIKVLVLDDDEVDLMAIQRYVKRHGLPWDMTQTQTLEEARIAISATRFDVAVIDHTLKHGAVGFDIMSELGEVPAILLTGMGSEQVAVQAIQRRVAEYVVKDASSGHLDRLRDAVRRVVSESWARLRSHAAALQAEVARQTSELQEKNRLLEAIVESMDEGLIAVDGHGQLLLRNRRALELGGAAALGALAQAREATDAGAARPGDGASEADVSAPLQRALQGAIVKDEQARDGDHWLNVTSTPLVSVLDSEPGGGRVIILRDVTAEVAREQAEAAQRHAEQANHAKSAFLAVMSHEIRTPINGIMGVLDLLCHSDLDDDQMHLLSTARQSTDNLLSLLSDVLDLAKIEAGRLVLDDRPFDLREIVQGVVGLFAARARQQGNEIVASFDDDASHILSGDAVRIRQVVTNLVSNAVKFTTHGRVHADVRIESQTDTSAWVAIHIHDTGIGIEQAHQRRIFDEFSQARTSQIGTGLGLSISKALVELMGGQLGVHSEPGVGSTFSVRLPLQPATLESPGEARESSAAPPADAARKVGVARALHILLVEDNAVNQLVTRRLLEKSGHQVTVVGNGVEALESYRSNRYDVIIMDCHMPVMDGYAATRAIRERESPGQRTPIIAMTADATAGTQERCMEAGMDACVIKPVRPDALFALLARSIAEPADRDDAAAAPAPADPDPG